MCGLCCWDRTARLGQYEGWQMVWGPGGYKCLDLTNIAPRLGLSKRIQGRGESRRVTRDW
eukprot:3574269-Rhodomonas_salina.2